MSDAPAVDAAPRSADPAAPTTMVELAGGPVEVADLDGVGPGADQAPLVLLHEGLGSLGLWRSLPADLHAATGRRTIAWSRHGYGQSAVVRTPRDVDYMHREATSALPELLERLGVDQPVLIGHSDGASIALVHAGRAGRAPAGASPVAWAQPTAIVLLAPHVVVEDVTIAAIEDAREAAETTDLLERMGRHHRDAEATFRGWNDIWLHPDFRDWDISEHLPGVTCPVLAIQGTEDEYGTMRQLDLVAEGVAGPTSRLELPDCRHAPHLDRPRAVRDAIVAFLDDLP